MSDQQGPRDRVESLKQVGRYAFGIQWGDGHDSIIPHRNVRRVCPCELCETTPLADDASPASITPSAVEVLGERSVFVRWADGHETVLLTSELRDLCRCAHCAGEPEYPISGR